MKRESTPVTVEPSKDRKSTVLTIDVSEEGAKRLQQAFADGMFAEFGVKAINVVAIEEPKKPAKQWRKTEVAKRTPQGDGTPPLP